MKELRWIEAREASLRDAGKTIAGHAARYDSLSEDLGGFVEIIRPGAFASVLRQDVRCLFNHNADLLLGRTRSRTLTLSDDGHGLAFEVQTPETTVGQDLRILMSRGDVTGCSFSFDIGDDRWSMQSGVLLREIFSFARLYDVGPVVFPAYPETDVGLRTEPHWMVANARRRMDLLLTS